MTQPTTPIATMKTQSPSLEEYIAATAQLGWEQELRQLDHATGPTKIQVSASNRAQIISVQYSNHIHQQIMPPEDCINFGILAKSQTPLRLENCEVSSESLMHFDRDYGLDAVVNPGFHAYTFSFAKDHLCELAEQHELPVPDGRLRPTSSARVIGSARTKEIRNLVEEVMLSPAHAEATQVTLQAMESTLPILVLQNWYGSTEPPIQPLANRTRALRKAIEYINTHPQQAVSVEQLCLVSASSFSTLERAFKNQFGLSPKRYLMASRLCGARHALLDRNDHRSITEIAYDWSFWHLGKFACDYKKMFGELPSQTRQTQ